MRLTADTFRALYLEYGPRAQGFFMRMTGYDIELSRDLTQDLFTRLWSIRDRYDSQLPFNAWMFTVAYNILRNEHRRQMTVMEYVSSVDKEESMELPDKIEQEQRKNLIHAAVDKLPEPQKAVFLLKYGEDLTITEIAKVCDIPEGTVKSRMDKLTELEKESRELLSDFRSMIDDENKEWKLAPLDITDQRQQKPLMRRIPSWVAVAAMLTGIAIGFAMPHHTAEPTARHTAFNYADTCRSIEQNDVNISLLVSASQRF